MIKGHAETYVKKLKDIVERHVRLNSNRKMSLGELDSLCDHHDNVY